LGPEASVAWFLARARAFSRQLAPPSPTLEDPALPVGQVVIIRIIKTTITTIIMIIRIIIIGTTIILKSLLSS